MLARPVRPVRAAGTVLIAGAAGAALACALALAGCAAPSDPGPARATERGAAARIAECRAGDREVASAAQCLSDDAACYEMATGAYCTGPRGATCPVGSSALATGQACPAGARCIRASESLECLIG